MESVNMAVVENSMAIAYVREDKHELIYAKIVGIKIVVLVQS